MEREIEDIKNTWADGVYSTPEEEIQARSRIQSIRDIMATTVGEEG